MLFPCERILRGIVGLESSTLGGLKNNIFGTMRGVAATVATGRNLYRGGKNIASGEAAKKAKEEKEKKQKEEQAKNEEKKRRKKIKTDSRAIRQQKKVDGTATVWDKAHELGSKAKDKVVGIGTAAKVAIGNSTVGQLAKKVAKTKVGSTALKMGKATMRAGKFALKNTPGFVKKATGIARKGYGLTMGAMEGIENFSKGEGAMSAAYTARSVAHTAGGFENQPKGPSLAKVASNQMNKMFPERAAGKAAKKKMPTRYQNGRKVAGNGKTTPGNVGGRSSNVGSTRVSNQIRTQLTTKQNGTMPDASDRTRLS